jgi:CxxC motif-containing protein (DUF1111 family)
MRTRLRLATIVLGSSALLAATTAAGTGPVTTFGDPLPGLTEDQLALFDAGKDEFEEEETPEEGLGPVFNETSCAACHNVPVIGGGSRRLETRFGRIGSNGAFDPMTEFGGSLVQDHSIGEGLHGFVFKAEVVPTEATVSAQRRSTPLFGLGLVDAVPDATFRAIAALQARFYPRTAGIVSLVTDPDTHATVVGKFGWKAQVSTLHAFAGDAYLNEMGVTSPSFPDENCPQGNCEALAHNPLPVPPPNDDGSDVEAFANFMTLLAPPPRGPITPDVIAGGAVFASIGCALCHLPVLQTGAHPVPALSRQTFFPFSDFLLHDMGDLGDGITQNLATGRLMRTAPLWGLRAQVGNGLLHDGRAHTIDDAILAHDGQGAASRDAFAALSRDLKAKLRAFLLSL